MTDVVHAFGDEIADLHRFFEDWFSGSGDRTIDEFSCRLDSAFSIVGPGGRKHGKEDIVRAVEARSGGYDVAITTSDVSLSLTDPVLVGTYRERHDFKGETTIRLSTVVMVADESVPTGYRWLSVHETWIEDSR